VAYPNLEQYNQALSAHSKLLSDPELRSGTLAKSGLGLPLAISGGFALTYTISTSRDKFAVRCFHRESKGLERRYAAISKKLASLRSSYFLAFQFQSQGIRVDGAAYPVVKMAWASGSTLGEFLQDNLRNSAALGRLADSLTQFAAYMQSQGIAHGDLQSGNLMVNRDGSSVQLIDYDGMFVDEIRDLGSAELGHVNFQHPQRKSLNPFDASLDRFSLITLSLSIRALQADPSLWDKTKSESDAILFRANDFLDPGNSSTFALIAKQPSLASQVANFAAVCKSPMAKAPDLADFLVGRNIPLVNIVLASPRSGAGAMATAGRAGYVGNYPVLPAIDYEACFRAVGDKVEVIGRVVEVKLDKTRGGKPYIFINFGPWRGQIFKAAIWADGLAHVKSKPDASWIGKWVSVVGLMEPPFVSKRYRYSHLSITVGAAGTMVLMSESDAQWRLAGAGKAAGVFTAASSGNQQTVERIRAVSGGASGRTSGTAASQLPQKSIAPSNAQVLQAIKGTSTPPAATPPSVSAVQRANKPPPPQQSGVVERLVKWFFG